MNEYRITIKGLEDYPRAAREFAKLMDRARIFAFYGKMGSGKTTLIKSICEELGVEGRQFRNHHTAPTSTPVYQRVGSRRLY